MNFRQIEAFRAIMTAGSVTGAARVMSVSQPAVSRLLGDLEADLGFALFQRHGRKMTATGEGRTFFSDVNRMFSGLDDLRARAEAIRSYRVGTLNLVTMPSLASRLLPELIADFAAVHPNIGVWLEVLPRSGVLDAVASGQYDLAVASMPVADRTLESTKLCTAQAYCVLPAGHRLAGKDTIKPRDLGGERFISLARDSLFRYTVDRLLEESGVECRNDIQARTADAIYGLVAAGAGVSIVGPDMPLELKSRKILFKPLSPALKIEIGLIVRDDAPVSRLAGLFMHLALTNAADMASPSGRRTVA